MSPGPADKTAPRKSRPDAASAQKVPKPPWIRVRIPSGQNYERVRNLVREKNLHTVCAEALCPNLGECWGRGTATFLVLGDICTRDCRFCGVRTGKPEKPRPDEPSEVADAVFHMNLKHAVITSVTRDDLPDGGAGIFAQVIRSIHSKIPECTVEVLVPDFRGDHLSIAKIVRAGPRIFGHNVETVPRLYSQVRSQADYLRSLRVLAAARAEDPRIRTKSGVMVGLGESVDEIVGVMADLRSAECDILTIGQYLSPTRFHFPVARYYSPDEFEELGREGLRLGFRHVESGPLVRSSYHAEAHSDWL
jgi:lipoyl synthase